MMYSYRGKVFIPPNRMVCAKVSSSHCINAKILRVFNDDFGTCFMVTRKVFLERIP